MCGCPGTFRMRRRKRLKTLLISILDRLISCLEICQDLSQGPWKVWLCASLFLVLLYTSVWRLFFYDPCNSAVIKKELCQQYQSGEITGSLCYPLCIQNTPYLSYCQAVEEEKSFVWHQTLFRVHPTGESKSWWKLQEGTQMSEFRDEMRSFLHQNLGHSMDSDLTDRLMQFADFNEDGKLSLGEAQSLWRLIHIQEFLLLFIFHKSSTFPNINGTCGHVYGFQYTPIPRLYNKEPNSWLSKVFANSYKWEFPKWSKRARISLGMVEFSMDIFEELGTKFLMCNVSPVKFGITYDYEAMLTSTKDIISEESVREQLQNRSCRFNSECTFNKHCISTCDRSKGMCSGEVIRPSLWFICDIIHEYLLFDTPKHLYYELKRLLGKCGELSMMDPDADLQHAVIYEDLKSFLWKEVQYNPNA